jgi:rhamnose transport system ATP-binding protein
MSEHLAMVDVSAVQCAGLGKRFGGTQALADLDLSIPAGTIHALVGENGAGKSTCLGIIGGRVAASEGTVSIFGERLHPGDPRAAREAGIAVIYQELTISPHLSTQANLFLGQEQHRRGLLAERAMRREFGRLCDRVEVHIPADVPAGALSVADQQMLEIMRALIGRPRIILFDEPTASLAEHEREVLFRVMRDLRASGVTLVLVSHNLDEVLAIANDVTVFRNGRMTASKPSRGWTKPELVSAMLGPEAAARVAVSKDRTPRGRVKRSDAVLRVRDLVVPGVVGPVDFDLCRREILGVGGVVGAGRTTLLSALAGLIPTATGQLWVEGVHQRWPTSVRQARRLGIAMVPEDRQLAGLFTKLSAIDNIVISDYKRLSRAGLLYRPRMRAAAAVAARPVGFPESRLSASADQFSGGNQQKLMLSRWQHAPPLVLLCDEPTRGIDVGAKAGVMASLRAHAAEGMAVVIVSSELEEIQDNADRAIVLSEGRYAGEVSNIAGDLTVKDMLALAFGAKEAS